MWEDQPEAVEERMATELPVLTAVPSRSVGAPSGRPHLLIEGDNLHALATLQYSHAGRVDVIYIDPPYNTGSKDFRYNDRYIDPDDEWRHSKWLSFMDRRIRLAKELLAPGGFLAVSIDDNEMAHLKLLLDQHFDEGNVKTIVVKMSEASGVKMASVKKAGTVPKLKEFVLLAQVGGVRGLRFDPIPKGSWDDEYRWVLDGMTLEQRQTIAELSIKESVTNDELAVVDRILAGASVKPVTDVMAGEKVAFAGAEAWKRDNAWRIVRTVASTSVKALADAKRSTTDQEFFAVRSKRDGMLYVVRGTYKSESKKPRVQVIFADDNLTQHPGDFWADIATTGIDAEGGVSFKNGKKPLSLLRRIVGAHPKKDAVVLDFFAGSGSTGHAVADLNAADGGTRQAILVTNNEGEICTDVTLPRMRGVLTGQLANGRTTAPLPGSLRYYRCDFVPVTSNRDAMLRRLAGRATDLVAVREDTHEPAGEEKGRWQARTGDDRTVVVWCDWDSNGLADVLATHSATADKALYLFSFDDIPDPAIVAAHPDWRIETLPEPIRAALELAHRRSSQ